MHNWRERRNLLLIVPERQPDILFSHKLERIGNFEIPTNSLEGWHSASELYPRNSFVVVVYPVTIRTEYNTLSDLCQDSRLVSNTYQVTDFRVFLFWVSMVEVQNCWMILTAIVWSPEKVTLLRFRVISSAFYFWTIRHLIGCGLYPSPQQGETASVAGDQSEYISIL